MVEGKGRLPGYCSGLAAFRPPPPVTGSDGTIAGTYFGLFFGAGGFRMSECEIPGLLIVEAFDGDVLWGLRRMISTGY